MMKRASTLMVLVLASACGQTSTEATTGTQQPPVSGELDAAVTNPQRSAQNRERDIYRHPAETLAFFGVEPHMTVLEVRPGRGWYTEILAPYLKESGKLIVGVPSAEGRRAKYRKGFMEMQAARPELLEAVDIVTFDPPSPIELGPSESVDMVLTFRNTHNWIGDGGEQQAYAAFFDVLRPGGVLGVVQHRAADGTDANETAKQGYVPEAYVVEVAEAAGFELVGSTDINRNAADTHDHPGGVWTLPPVLRLGEEDKAKYLSIGESDRMTLKFRKPVSDEN